MSSLDAPSLVPDVVAPGQAASLRVRGIDDAVRIVLTRGRDRCLESTFTAQAGEPSATLQVPADAVRGVYTAVIHRRLRPKLVIRDGLSILETTWRDPPFPALPEYDRWHYVQDADGIPMKDMGGRIGYVRHPLVATYFASRYAAIAADANDARAEDARRGFLALVAWLESQSSDGPRGSLVIRHAFPLSVSFRLEPGWISGLTQGRVAEIFLTAARVTGAERFRELARRCCEIMRVPVEEGGLLSEDRFGGVVIEEYPTDPASWALNGIGSAINSLETIGEQLGLEWAGDLVDRVAASLGSRIPLFDAPDPPLGPGSRVQLALRYDVVLRARSPWGRRPARLALHAVRVEHHAHAPTSASGAAVARPRIGQDARGESLVSSDGRLDLELLLSSNRDPFDGATEATCRLELDLECSATAMMRLDVHADRGRGRIGRMVLRPGRRTITFVFDPDAVVPGGVGRVARWNETYHTTNLAWMWQISRFGADPRVSHAARRWLFSLHTGRGRVPVEMDGIDLEPLRRHREEAAARSAGRDSPPTRAARMQVAIADGLLGWAAGDRPRPEIAWVGPRRIPSGAARTLTVAGFGFVGGEQARVGPCEAWVQTRGADELELRVPPLPAGLHAVTIRTADGDPIPCRPEQVVTAVDAPGTGDRYHRR